MSAPVVGIMSYVELARFTVWEMTATLLPHAYVEQVVRAGGQPVVLPPAGDPSSVLPVQWHPEADGDPSLFAALVNT